MKLTEQELKYWGSEENFANHSHCNDESGPIYYHDYVVKQQAELRNKVIQECIDSISGLSVLHPKKVHEILNSLKTKP